MNYTSHIAVLLKEILNFWFIPKIKFFKNGLFTSDCFNAVQNINGGIGKIIHNYYFKALILQFNNGVRHYKAQPTCYKYFHYYLFTKSITKLVIKSICSLSNSVCIGSEITSFTNLLVTGKSSSL